jgi:hypothetical protein
MPRNLSLLLIVVIGAVVGIAAQARAEDEDSTAIDALLTNWSAASRNCRSLDVRFHLFSYDPAFDKKTEEDGRFYFEGPETAVYQIGGKTQIIWTPGLTSFFDHASKRVDRCPREQLENALRRAAERSVDRQQSWLGARLVAWYGDIFLRITELQLMRPDDACPCLLLMDPGSFRKLNDLKLDTIDGKPWLTAKPKRATKYQIQELQFIFDITAMLPEAVKEIRIPGERVFVLKTPQIDQTPVDREQLLNPDLKHWKEQTFPD